MGSVVPRLLFSKGLVAGNSVLAGLLVRGSWRFGRSGEIGGWMLEGALTPETLPVA